MARRLLSEDTFEVAETDLDLEITPDPDARYTLRALSTSAARQLAKAHTRQEFSKTDHRKVDVVDSQGLNDAIIDYIIVAWQGVGDDGAAPCTKDNKLALPVPLQKALLDRAQVGEGSAEVRAASFREPGRMVPVLGR